MFKLFGLWDTASVKVEDEGLKGYITLDAVYLPRTQGRFSKQQFYKGKYHIVERLINRLMVPGHKGKKHYITSGHCGGKAHTAMNIVEKTFKIIEQKTKKNPIEVFVKAIENGAPRDEITTIEYGGARYPQAVDCAPLRRIDVVLRMFVQGAYGKSFGKKIKMVDALADEIILAYGADQKSTAVAKKIEFERQADASR